MHILYLLSRYPTISETFIVREMQQLINFGNEITIAQLRWAQPRRSNWGMRVSKAHVIASQFDLWSWFQGFEWALRTRPTLLKQIWHQLLLTLPECDLPRRFKLFTVFLTTLRIAQCLDKCDIELIRNRFLDGGAISAMWLSYLLEKPYSLTISTLNAPYAHSITQKAVRYASFCTAPTKESYEFVVALRGSSENVYLVKTGLDLNQLQPPLGMKSRSSRPLIVAVGRLVTKKGFDILIRACKRLREWGLDFSCEIIGSGPEYKTLVRLIDELQLFDHVLLVGVLPFEVVKARFNQAWLSVMPSRVTPGDVDGLPNVITESLALKVPVVATAVAAIPEFIIDEVTGLLVLPNDVEQLAGAIRRLIEDETLRIRLADAGYERVQREYNVVDTVKDLEELIHSHAYSKSCAKLGKYYDR